MSLYGATPRFNTTLLLDVNAGVADFETPLRDAQPHQARARRQSHGLDLAH